MASVTPVTLSDGQIQLDPEPGDEDSVTWSVRRVGGSPLLGRLTLRQESPAPHAGPWSRARLHVQVDAPVDSALVATLSMAVRLSCQWAFSALGISVITWMGPLDPTLRSIVDGGGFRVHSLPHRNAWDGEKGPQDAWFADAIASDAQQREFRPLTARETSVLTLIARGYTNSQIAQSLGISENTVKNHVRAILDALRATSRTAALVVALQSGLVSLSSKE